MRFIFGGYIFISVFFDLYHFFRPISVFETTAIIKTCKFTVFSSGSFCQIYRVTDEALIAETVVWPNFFLMNVFFALKRSKLLSLFLITAAGCCTIWRPLKVSPHSFKVQIIFYFWSFEIMEGILRTWKRSYAKIHFLNKFEIF